MTDTMTRLPTAFVSAERQGDGLYHWTADDSVGDPLTEGVADTRAEVDSALTARLPGYWVDIRYIDNGHGL